VTTVGLGRLGPGEVPPDPSITVISWSRKAAIRVDGDRALSAQRA